MSNPGSDQDLQAEIDRLQADLAALQQSRRRIVEAEAADRRELERALHDGLQQRLVALAADVQYLARQLDQDPASAKGLIDAMSASLRESLGEATALAQRLYPPLLDGRGLATSLRSAAAAAGLTLVVEMPPAAGYPPEVSAAIYRSCAETFASASPGSLVGIGVGDADGGVTFEVAVEGRPSAALLKRLRDRIEALDGRLTVDQEDGTSRLRGWLPLSG